MEPKHFDFFKPKDGMIFLPEVIIITAPRAGTSSLYFNMRKHPKFYPHDLIKETYMLSWNWEGEEITLPRFKKMYTHPEGTFNMEGSPADFTHMDAPERIWHFNPKQKFIAMFRDPVIRAHENFWMVVKDGLETVSTFEEAIALEPERINGGFESLFTGNAAADRNYRLYPYLERGKYVKHLKNWLKWFPKEQFLFIKSEDYFTDSAAVLRQVCEFIGVEHFVPEKIDIWWDALATKGAKHGQWPVGELKSETAISLYDMFRPYNEELSELLQRDFTWEFMGASKPPPGIQEVMEAKKPKTIKLMLGGVMMGDSFHAIPLLNRFMDEGWEKIIWMCGSYMKPVVEFLTNFYPIEMIVREDLSQPDSVQTRINFKKHYLNDFNKIEADGEFFGEYETFDWIAYSTDISKYDLNLRNAHLIKRESENSIVIHPYTLHTWKNPESITKVNWGSFGLTLYTAGGKNEPQIPGSIDLRGMSFMDVAQRVCSSQLVVGIHSAIACMTMYLNHPAVIVHPWGNENNKPDFLTFGYFKSMMHDLVKPSVEELTEAVKQKLTN